MSFFSKLFGREPKTMDWRQFIQHFAERIRRDCAADVQIEWGESLEDTVLQVGEGRLYLGNHYARYLQSPADLDALLAANTAVVRQMMAERPPARAEQVFPVIKNGLWLEQLRQATQVSGTEPEESVIYRPIAGDLVLLYMLDTGEAMRSLSREDAVAAGLADDAALHHTALANLRQYMQGKIQIEHVEESSLTQILLDSDYDASLILLLNEILPSDPVLPANPVLAIPARNVLILCNPSNKRAIATLKVAAAQIAEEAPYTISTLLYQYHNGEISLFQPH